MRNYTKKNWYSFLCFLSIVFLVSSCDKDVVAPDALDESYTVAIKFKEFESSTTPLGKNARVLADKAVNKWASTNPRQTKNIQQGYLYYWSFNNETLSPDIRVVGGAKITYNGGLTPDRYAGGWKYDTYSAGRALNLTGVQEFIFEIPLIRVLELQTLGFDIGSSNTGPKAFDLFYSQDGEEYEALAKDNQFTNINTAQAKNSFQFDLTTLELDLSKKLFLKIIPKAGERGTSTAYNSTSGVTRIDNFHLIGVSEVVEEATVFKLHYHIFDADNRNMVMMGTEVFEPGNLPDLSLSLPIGNYYASFVSNVSNAELNIPERANADDYFMANSFSNHRAQIFGLVDTFAVDSEMQIEATLQRYYSQIRFEFTDSDDLSHIGKLIFTPEHDPYFYSPFVAAMGNPVLDQSEIILIPNFEEDGKEIVFHQFMGRVVTPQPIQYRVEVYDKVNELLRTFTVSSSIKENVQLVFRGQLLTNQQEVTFTVRQNEEWGGETIVSY